MDQIAAEAGVSKQTVYSHFGAKDVLFEEIVSCKCTELMGEDGLQVGNGEEPAVMLYDTAKVFLHIVLTKESITLYRTILSECGRFPELAQAFYRAGPKTAIQRLATYLDQVNNQQLLEIPDSKAAAGMFFAMLRGDLFQQCLLELRDMPDDAEIARTARWVADAFIQAHLPKKC